MKNFLENYNVGNNSYSFDYFLSILTSNPFVCVWGFSLLVWFFLELNVWISHMFNSKHSYGNFSKRNLLFLLVFVKVTLNKKVKINILKSVYKLYI